MKRTHHFHQSGQKTSVTTRQFEGQFLLWFPTTKGGLQQQDCPHLPEDHQDELQKWIISASRAKSSMCKEVI